MYLRLKSGVPGLYLKGKEIIHDGLAPCLDAGLNTAGDILNGKLVNDLTAVSEEVQLIERKLYNKDTNNRNLHNN